MPTVEPRIKTRYIEPGDVGFSVIPGKIVVLARVQRLPQDHSQRQDLAEIPEENQ